jgi:adenylate kinase
MNEDQHAQQIVGRFKSLLDNDTIAAVGDEHFEVLALMIESAIDTSTLRVIRNASEISEKAARDIIHIIERY